MNSRYSAVIQATYVLLQYRLLNLYLTLSWLVTQNRMISPESTFSVRRRPSQASWNPVSSRRETDVLFSSKGQSEFFIGDAESEEGRKTLCCWWVGGWMERWSGSGKRTSFYDGP
ncbi:hypothetical protein PM082_007276 [Marasmius tenuissimus]|nr:hypothetical protein PM082_007276 [Marasmius tenuissimus]